MLNFDMKNRELKCRYVFRHDVSGEITFEFFDLYDVDLITKAVNRLHNYMIISIDQWSSLVDKHNVKIYENDFVIDDRDFGESNVKIIEFMDGSFRFHGWSIPSYVDKWCTVVGNKHKNDVKKGVV